MAKRPKSDLAELVARGFQSPVSRRNFLLQATKLGISAGILGKIAPTINASGTSVATGLPVFKEVSATAGFYTTPTRSFGSPNWGDLNNDGFLDLIVPFHHGLPQVYINNGDGTFTQSFDSGIVHGLDDDDDWHGQALGDLNNDGCLDLCVTEGAEKGSLVGHKSDQLFQGLCNGTFENVTTTAGTQNAYGRGRSPFWVDYDNDGWLDLFVKNWHSKNVLYHNNRDGTFTDFGAAAGLADLTAGWVVSFEDYDRDGYMDMVISSGDCQLLHNDGDGTFRNVTTAAGIAPLSYNKGVAWGDYNNDGLIDLFFTSGSPAAQSPGVLKPNLYRNNGDGTFTDVTASAGLDIETNSYSAVWGDFDNDGFLDLFVAAIGAPNGINGNRLFHNNGDGTFTDVAESVGLRLTETTIPHCGSSWGDYDNDGFLDLVIKDGLPDSLPWGVARLFHNSGNANHFLKVALIGTQSNRLAIGAKVHVTNGSQTLFREHNGGGGGEFHSQGQQPLHFGLGPATSTVSLKVRWPSGHTDKFTLVPVDSLVTVTENSPGLQARRLRL